MSESGYHGYTILAMNLVNSPEFSGFRDVLDADGLATAALNVPGSLGLPLGFTFHHAYLVYDASGRFHLASNAVPLRVK